MFHSAAFVTGDTMQGTCVGAVRGDMREELMPSGFTHALPSLLPVPVTVSAKPPVSVPVNVPVNDSGEDTESDNDSHEQTQTPAKNNTQTKSHDTKPQQPKKKRKTTDDKIKEAIRHTEARQIRAYKQLCDNTTTALRKVHHKLAHLQKQNDDLRMEVSALKQNVSEPSFVTNTFPHASLNTFPPVLSHTSPQPAHIVPANWNPASAPPGSAPVLPYFPTLPSE